MTDVTDTDAPVGPPIKSSLAVCRGLAVIADQDTLIIEGAPFSHRFTGQAAAAVLPRVLNLLDGSRAPEEVASILGIGRSVFDRMTMMLGANGLLDEIPTKPSSSVGLEASEVSTYFSRLISAQDGYRGSQEIMDTLARAVVLVAMPEDAAASVVADLTDTGVGTVLRESDSDSARVALAAASHRLVILWEEAGGPHSAAEFARGCSAWTSSGIPVLRCAIRNGHIELGPYFHSSHTACESCFRRGYRALTSDVAGSAGARPDTASDELLASLVTSETIAVLLRTARLVNARQFAQIPIADFTMRLFDVVPEWDCASCGGPSPSPSPPEPPDSGAAICEIYEWLSERPLTELAPSARTSPQWLRGLQELATRRKVVSHAPRRPLPDSGSFPLGRILARTAGYRVLGERGRWAPSGGNLGSVEIYGMCGDNLSQALELPGTVFRYDDLSHALVGVHTRPDCFGDALKLSDLPADQQYDAVLIFVAALGRLSAKYRSFGYRLALLDAGCAATQLALVASDIGLRAAFANSWDADLGTLLDLAPGHEAVTAVVGLIHNEEEQACR